MLDKYRIETASQEFTIPSAMLNKVIEGFWLDGYQVLNDDTGELMFQDNSGNSPTVVYRLEADHA
jgi:hypothetical protein